MLSRRPGRPRKPVCPAKPGSRDAGDMSAMQDKLVAHVKANLGQRGEQVAAELGSDVVTVRLPMKKLIAAGQVRTEGERRGMMYFPGGRGAGPARPAAKKSGRPGKRKRARTSKRRARKAH